MEDLIKRWRDISDSIMPASMEYSVSRIVWKQCANELEEKIKLSNIDYAKCKSIGCQFYDETMECNCSANENLCEKCMNSQHFV